MTRSELKELIHECINERYELNSINEDTDIELVEEAALRFKGEPTDLLKHLKNTYTSEDFENISEELINKRIDSNYKRGIEKEWAKYEKEWADADSKYKEDYKIHMSKIKAINKLDCVMIWNDCAGTELGYDLKSKRIYCFDHNYGFISSSISIKELLSL